MSQEEDLTESGEAEDIPIIFSNRKNRYSCDRGWLGDDKAQEEFLKDCMDFEDAWDDRDEDNLLSVVNRILETSGHSHTRKALPERFVRLVADTWIIPLTNNAIVQITLTAVSTGSRALVEALHQKLPSDSVPLVRNETNNYQTRLSIVPHFIYPSYMTPLMLACIMNNFGIAQFFLSKGHRLQPAHRDDCYCKDCSQIISDSDAHNHYLPNHEYEMHKLDAYRAAASPAFIWLGTKDPFMSCVELVNDLNKCIGKCPENVAQYKALRNQVRHLLREMVELCNNGKEVEALFINKSGCSVAECSSEIPRLRAALGAEVKETLSHPVVQNCIRAHWIGDFEKKERITQLLFVALAVVFPVWSIVAICSWNQNNLIRSTPFLRFVAFTSSYLVFLLMCLAQRFYGFGQSSTVARSNHHTLMVLEAFVFTYVLGYICHNLYFFKRRGPRLHFQLWWTWIDYIGMTFFLIAMVCWGAFRMESAQFVHIHRRHLHGMDSYVIFELFFSLGTFMTSFKLIYFLQLSQSLGKFVVSSTHTSKHYVRYITIFAFIFLSFGVMIAGIYGPYSVKKSEKIAYGIKDSDGFRESDNSFLDTIQHLYWKFFGMQSEEYVDRMTVGFAGPKHEPIVLHSAKLIGSFAVGLYLCVMVLAISNIMIAMVVTILAENQKNLEEEWRFARLYVYWEYLTPGTLYPPPFNIFQMIYLGLRALTRNCTEDTISDFWNGSYPSYFNAFLRNGTTDYGPPPGVTSETGATLQKVVDEIRTAETYARLMITLFYRYIHTREHEYSDPYSNLTMRKRKCADFSDVVRYDADVLAAISAVDYDPAAAQMAAFRYPVPAQTPLDQPQSMPMSLNMPNSGISREVQVSREMAMPVSFNASAGGMGASQRATFQAP